MLREWMWRGGRLRVGVTSGLFVGICIGVFSWLGSVSALTAGSALIAASGGVVGGAAFGIVMAVFARDSAWWNNRQLSGLPPPDRVAVMRAVTRGEPVSDPRLAPDVLAYATIVVAFARRQRDQRAHWVLLVIAVPALGLAVTDTVLAVIDTVRGPVRLAAVWWVLTAILLCLAWRAPGILDRQRAKAQAAADFAAGQIGRPPAG